jgi:iron(III) transport system permease protein
MVVFPPLWEGGSVTRWRLAVASVLLLFFGVPLVLPFTNLLAHVGGWEAWHEGERLAVLAGTTARLAAGSLALALPAGILGAVLLYRTDLPFRGLLRSLTILALFIPLPLVASAWQATLGTGGWLPVALWSAPPPGDPDIPVTGTAWKVWPRGIGAAIWVHALAALPWVILLVGQGLCWVERDLEEDALLATGPSRVFWRVTWPRTAASIWAAGLWVVLLVATEITVTDLMQVRTFAEEVYTQFVAGGPDALARAVAVSLPLVFLTWMAVLWAGQRWQRSLPPLESATRSPLLFPLGSSRWPCLVLVLLALAVFAGVPVTSLVWKAGLQGTPPRWSATGLRRELAIALAAHGSLVVDSFGLATAAGGLAALLAVVVCWLARDSQWFRTGTFGLMAAIWALPGPVLCFGLLQAIQLVLDLPGWATDNALVVRLLAPDTRAVLRAKLDAAFQPLAIALYYGPSPVPVFWVYVLRFFPCAVAVLWPVVRLIPTELCEAIRVDGARPAQEFRYLILPLSFAACIRAGLAVLVLSLGELSASKPLETPGSQTFAHKLWEQLHYSTTADVSALCLVLLGVVLLGGLVWAVADSILGRLLDRPAQPK